MAREHEMVSTLSSVPEGMLGGDELHVIGDELLERGEIVGIRLVEILNHPSNAEWHEEDVSFLRDAGPESMASMLHLMNESPLTGVNVFAWAIMHYWKLPFFIHIHLESSFHFSVTPACMHANIIY